MDGDINDIFTDLGDDVEVIYVEDYEIDDGMEDDGEEGQADINTEIVDLSTLTFKRHTRSVFSCDVSVDGKLAVTGGEDDVAYIWSTSNEEVYMECTGHKDSVTEVCFNHDCRYVATGDLGGLIQVWNVREKKLVWCYEGGDLEWLTWHQKANVLIVGMQSGDIFVWQIPEGLCKVMASHGMATSCGKLLPDGKTLLVGYSDGCLKLWDIKTTSVLWQLNSFKELTSIDINLDGSLAAVAPSAEVIKLSDGKIIGQYLSSSDADVEAISFGNGLDVLVTGSLTGYVCVWDIAKQALRHQIHAGANAITTFKWTTNSRLLVGTVGGTIYVGDIRTGTLLETLTGHRDDILSMCVSQDKSFILSTSDDCTAKIFKVPGG